MENFSYVVSESLVKNKTLQLVREKQENVSVQHKMEQFVVNKLAIAGWANRLF